jgi:hypothetical protein
MWVSGSNRLECQGRRKPCPREPGGLLGARDLDCRQFADRLLGHGQPLAVRVDLGHEVFGVLFIGLAGTAISLTEMASERARNRLDSSRRGGRVTARPERWPAWPWLDRRRM